MRDSPPWTAADAGPEAKKHAPATTRNRDAILDVLRDVLPERGKVLEIASGSGEHIVYFADALPDLHWQPSDPDAECRASIAAWARDAERANLAPPIDVDASSSDWPIDQIGAILCINMIHIAPWEATEGLMAGAGRVLSSGAPLLLYGPYSRADAPTAPSNLDFDRSLRSRNPQWGLRNLEDVTAEAEKHRLVLERLVEMPANNLSLAFRKI